MIFQLLRVQQWYKNLLIFLPLIFVGFAGHIASITLTALGFISLCLLSSANYILNDITDKSRDRLHPEKKNRPLAAGKIAVEHAAILALLLASTAFILALKLSPIFFLIEILFFSLTLLYTFWLKHEVFVDIILIATNYVLRAVGGAYILQVRVSPWLILCTFFLALFLAAGKRRATAKLLENKAKHHKPVLKAYTESITNALMLVTTCLLLLSYSLYSFLSIHPSLIYTLPFSFYVIFRWYHLVEEGSAIPRKPELVYKDTRLILGIFLWTIAVLIVIYL